MMKTGAVRSCIQEMKLPKPRAVVPPSVLPLLWLPASPSRSFHLAFLHRADDTEVVPPARNLAIRHSFRPLEGPALSGPR